MLFTLLFYFMSNLATSARQRGEDRPTRKADNTDKVPEGRREGGRQREREREREDGSYNPAPSLIFCVKSQCFQHRLEQQITARTMCSPIKNHLPCALLYDIICNT